MLVSGRVNLGAVEVALLDMYQKNTQDCDRGVTDDCELQLHEFLFMCKAFLFWGSTTPLQ